MGRLLSLDRLQENLSTLIRVRSAGSRYGHYRPQVALALHHVLLAGPTARGEFMTMTGMPERSASRMLSQLLDDRLLVSDTPRGPVRFNFPLDALNILLPGLYPEASALVDDD